MSDFAQDQPVLIQGQSADSQDEIVISMALDRMKAPYLYHYEPYGSMYIRGNIQIDFLVLIPPRPIPLFINGRYWHSGKFAGEIELQITELDAQMAGEFSPSVVIWDDEFETVEDAVRLIHERLQI